MSFKQLIKENIISILSEELSKKQKEMIDYHDEMSNEHNSLWQLADRKLSKPSSDDKKIEYWKKARDAHLEAHTNHTSARNAWKKGTDLNKAQVLSKKADDFDHLHTGKGTFLH